MFETEITEYAVQLYYYILLKYFSNFIDSGPLCEIVFPDNFFCGELVYLELVYSYRLMVNG